LAVEAVENLGADCDIVDDGNELTKAVVDDADDTGEWSAAGCD